MANLTINAGGRAIETKRLQVRELKAGVTLEQAIEKTQANGIDETFVEADGKKFVIYSEDNLQFNSKASIQIDGKAAKVLHESNEINSFGEGLVFVPAKGYQIAKSALAPVLPNAATGIAIAGGMMAGAISRNALLPFSGSSAKDLLPPLMGFSAGAAGLAAGTALGIKVSDGHPVGALLGFAGGTVGGGMFGTFLGDMMISNAGRSQTTGIGIGLGAIAGVAMVTAHADQDSSSTATRQIKAWATGVGSVGLGAASPELIRLAAQIKIPELAVKGAKIAGVAALAGGTMATLGLAAAGAMKEAHPKTLDEIAK